MLNSRLRAGVAGLASLPVTLFGLVLVTFLIGRAVPIDPVLAIVGDHAPADVVAHARAELGLDQPLIMQFWIYLRHLAQFDLGTSVMTQQPVTTDIGQYFPPTLELATAAMLIALALGVPLGVLSAWWRGSWFDHSVRLLTLVGQSVPVFVLALLALLVFYVKLDIAPGTGQVDVIYQGMVSPVTGMLVVDAALDGQWDVMVDALAHLALPALVLAYFSLAPVARLTRSFMQDALSGEYIITARAKGLSSARILWRHAFGNVAVPLVTVVVLAYANLLQGAVLTETVFSWPGLGQYLTVSLLNADLNAVLGATLVVGFFYVVLNLLADLAYRLLDPPRSMSAALRNWLLSDTPASPNQAAWGRRARFGLALLRNRLAMIGLVTVVFLLFASLAAPLLATHNPDVQSLSNRLAPPSAQHWLGTDELGRDLYSRLLFGGRVTLGMVVAVLFLVAPFGLLIGTVAGYVGGFVDTVLMRICDVFLSLPSLILALALVAALRPGIGSAIIAVALTTWPPYARLARAETLALRRSDFISAVRLSGASPARIILRHISPLCVSSLVVRATLDMSGTILTVAGLGFLGMGAQPPMPEWGTMIAGTRAYILQQWWVPTAPGLAIFVASLAFNLLGDGLRDVLDPKQG